MFGHKIIVKKQPDQLLNTNREFFLSCDISNCHEYVKEFLSVRPLVVAILHFVPVRDKEASSVSISISMPFIYSSMINAFRSLVQVEAK